ncbi:MAG: capsule assembly Wzi family protein, partial [Terracidiphilus sp.]
SLLAAEPPGAPRGAGQSGGAGPIAPVCEPAALGSPFIPVDSWVYPAMLRLYGMGFVDNMFLGLRPWTRASVEHMLEDTAARIEDADSDGDPAAGEAQEIYQALDRFLYADVQGPCLAQQGSTRIESVYSVARGISGTPLHDSYHLGSTLIDDYGRPYENGFNNYSGVSGYATAGRFALYVRGEFQGAPSAAGYSASLAQALSTVDGTPYYIPASTPPYANTTTPYSQATIPMGPIGTATQGRFLEAYVSAQVLNHVISIGKQDDWLGPGLGGAMAFSNNAQSFYSFHIDRIEPLNVPLLSRLTGPFRYEFLVGALRGHTLMPNPAYEADPSTSLANVINPGDPWVHLEKISFRPTQDLEFGFERTAIWGGEGHSPVTFRDFFKSFFSFASPSAADKNGRNDPGARFGAFDFSYRLPYLRKWLTLYADSEVHDDVSPVDAPRRAAYRPGIYLSHVPGVPKLDLRVEAATTDPSASTVSTREYGHFMYYEGIERQGYTNQGQLFGDWIGREDKGGQAWMTYHLSGNEWIQVNARNQKATKDFIPGSTTETFTGKDCPLSTPCLVAGGTTLNDFGFQVVKRIGKDIEVNGNFTLEHWKAPIYLPGEQTVTTTDIQVTWYPERKVSF